MFRATILSLDDGLAADLRPALEHEGLEVIHESPVEGWEPDPAAAPDVLIVDWRDSVPPQKAEHFVAWPDSLTLALVAQSQVDRIDPSHGLEDFLVVPLHATELLARVRQILWRHGRAAPRNALAAGDLMVDLGNYAVFESGHPITLTFKEFELLRFLMTHAQQVFNRDALLNRVWGYNYYGGARTVDVHIRRLRSKLDGSGHEYVETVRNVGYRFALPLR